MRKRLYLLFGVFVVSLLGAVGFGGPFGCSSGGPGAQLVVTISGAASGLVSSNTGGISCTKTRGPCSAQLSIGKQVTLTAQPDSGFLFGGWFGGGCSGTASCTLTMDADKSVRAVFILIAFSSQKDPKNPAADAVNANFTNNIWTIGADGGNPKPLTLLTAARASSFDPQWSSDGLKIAFDSNRALDGSDAANNPGMGLESNLWIVKADGTGSTPLTQFVNGSGIFATHPQWSPDGTKLLYLSNQAVDGSLAPNTNNTANVWVINADGTGAVPLTKLTSLGANSGNFGFEWSPDGTKIVFTSARDFNPAVDGTAGTDNIWVMNADGSSPEALTHLTKSLAQHFSPQWSLDGTKISFDSGRSLDPTADDTNGPTGVRNVWVMNADGSGQTALTRLTAASTDCTSARWSPDGTRISFESPRSLTPANDATNTDSTFNIWAMNADGGAPHPITNFTVHNADAFAPQWSPDGTNFLFESEQDLNGTGNPSANLANNLWVIHDDGSVMRPVTRATVSGEDSRDGDWDLH